MQVIFQNSAPFSDYTTEMNITQVDNAKYNDVVMPMYDLIEYSDNYSGTTGSLWQYCKYEPRNPVTDSNSFKFKLRLLANTNERGIANAEVAVALKYFSTFGELLKCLQLIAKLILF